MKPWGAGRRRALLGGATLTEAAKKFNVAPLTFEAIDRNGKDPAGKPVTGLPEGVAVLHANAIKGKGAMPPKGGNPSLSDADVFAAVDYMVSAAK